MMARAGTCVDARSDLHRWLCAALGTHGPFELEALGGGNSNETAVLSAPSARWIIRRPPPTAISATANNLEREFRVLTALVDTDVPVPRPVAYAAPGLAGEHSCLVMELSPGYPLTSRWPADWPAAVAIGQVGGAVIEALAALHQVDAAAVGLGDFGRPERYLERQVARWRSQFEQNQVRDLPRFDELATWLEANRPAETSPAILHGDFHMDNCLVLPGPPAKVSAIIDWELATIGDPLVDLGLLLGFWGPDRNAPVAMPAVQALTRVPGAPSRRELADRYSQLSGRSTDALTFYIVLAFFKLAAIVEGAYARFVRGLDDSAWARSLGDDVPRLLEDAAAQLS
jgi:aminoglycoside phosphotransferase (APT) family kinase protein